MDLYWRKCPLKKEKRCFLKSKRDRILVEEHMVLSMLKQHWRRPNKLFITQELLYDQHHGQELMVEWMDGAHKSRTLLLQLRNINFAKTALLLLEAIQTLTQTIWLLETSTATLTNQLPSQPGKPICLRIHWEKYEMTVILIKWRIL